MNTQTLRDCILECKAKKQGMGHFNVSDSTQFMGIVEVAAELNVPVIIGVSEGEADFIGRRNLAALVATQRAMGHQVYLNADHTHTLEGVQASIDAGFDAVIIDGAKLSLDENIALTKKAVELARGSGRDVLVEAELGYIGESSKMMDGLPQGLEVTSVADAVRFVTETGIDLFAPAVGNVHGMMKEGGNPRLNIERIREIVTATGVPLVLHGGSGIANEDFTAAINEGMTIVHINTEIRLAYRTGIFAALSADLNEVAPYKYLGKGKESLKAVVRERLQLFTNAH